MLDRNGRFHKDVQNPSGTECALHRIQMVRCVYQCKETMCYGKQDGSKGAGKTYEQE